MHQLVRIAAIGVVAASAVIVVTAASASKPATAQPRGSHHEQLVHPRRVTIDQGLSKQRAKLDLLRVRQLYTFWDTGDTRYLRQADSPTFVDHTLPAGRPQGLTGIAKASKTFRAAVPDLRCTVADVLITGNRASVRQIYTGHFTGTYNGVRGHGQTIRFIAFDIQQLGKRHIVGDWHLEDNLTFLQQIGAVK